MKLGLALSGGSIKGAAHIGLLQAFLEENINIDYISGASSGSIVATLHAAGYTPKEIFSIFKKYAKKINYIEMSNIFKLIKGLIFKRRIMISGFNNGKNIETMVNKLCKQKNITYIHDIKMPLIIPSVSLQSGAVYLFSSLRENRPISDGIIYNSNIEIGKCVRASSAFPGVFEPLSLKNDQLTDGGIRENIPWKELKKLGADITICVIFEEVEDTDKIYTSFIDTINRSLNILAHELYNYELHNADFILKIKTPKITLLDISKIDELYNIGYKETKKAIYKIKLLLNKTKDSL